MATDKFLLKVSNNGSYTTIARNLGYDEAFKRMESIWEVMHQSAVNKYGTSDIQTSFVDQYNYSSRQVEITSTGVTYEVWIELF